VRTLDRRAVLIGGLWHLALAVPFGVLVSLLKNQDSPGQESNLWVIAAVLAVVVAPTVGGYQAGKRQPSRGLLHSAVAVGAASGAIVVVRFAVWLFTRDNLHPLTLFLYLYVTVSLGMVGGYVAYRRVDS
jgi:putative membrane protein (TIGR04086 family)